ARWRRCPRLPLCHPRLSRCRGLKIRQQEEQDRPEAHLAGGEERRGAEQAAGIGDDCERRSSSQHSQYYSSRRRLVGRAKSDLLLRSSDKLIAFDLF
ncbi:hypothetical protein LINPERPRIM_LOCUS6406, partial [Linum perenne]